MGLPTPSLHPNVDDVPWNKCIPLPLSSCAALVCSTDNSAFSGRAEKMIYGSVTTGISLPIIYSQLLGTIRFSHCPHGDSGLTHYYDPSLNQPLYGWHSSFHRFHTLGI